MVRTKLAVERWRSHDGKPPRYQGTWGTLRVVASEEGMRGLFRGLTPALVVNAPAAAMFFGVYKQVSANAACTDTCASALGGAAAWIATCVAFNPLFVLKTKQQTQLVRPHARAPLKYRGMFSSAQTVLREQGIRGLYVGTVAACAGAPGAMVQMPLYERLKGDDPSTARVAMASATSSATIGLIAYPLEVVRLRLQAQGPRRAHDPEHYAGMLDGFRKIYQREGVRAFYRGCGTALIRTVPQSAIALSSFETILRLATSVLQNVVD